MVAGDTKKIVVIKNISSNLIEEAILILKNDADARECESLEKHVRGGMNSKNDFILKEAENIINQYIKDNGLTRVNSRRGKINRRFTHFNISINTIINIILMAATAFLILVISKIVQ